MSEIILRFENSSIKNRVLKVIELINGVTIVNPKKSDTQKNGLDKALEDVKSGRLYKAKNVDDLFEQILG